MRRASRAGLVVAVVVTVVGLSKVHAAVIAQPAYDYTGSFRFAWSMVLIGLVVASLYAVGLPDLPRNNRGALVAGIAAAAASALGLSLVQMVTGDALLPRFVLFGTAAIVPVLGVVAHAVSARGTSQAAGRERVVVVSPAGDAEVLKLELDSATALQPALVVASIHPDVAGLPGRSPLVDLVREHDATLVVLDGLAQQDDRVVAQAAALHEGGVRVRTLSLFYEEWLGKLPVGELERVSLLFDIGELHRARYGRTKRVLDIALGLVGGVGLAILLPVVWGANLVSNRGPLFFRQVRVGRGGEPFTMLKLRTMAPRPADDSAGEWTGVDDPRITPFGRLLRVSHLDELPQVINVLRGDLSIVGPRPEQPHYVEELTEKLPFYGLRHLVRPGLTGWAQVMYGYAGDERDALEKLQYEFFYLRRQGTALDLRIVGRTMRSVVGVQGGGR